MGQQVAEIAHLPAPRILRQPLNRFTLSRPKKDFCGDWNTAPPRKFSRRKNKSARNVQNVTARSRVR
jgi:hypothetical protein